MAVKTAGKGGSATLLWDYQRAHQKIELYGPFGGGRVQISTQSGATDAANKAVLKDTKGNTIEGATAAEVLYQRLGWQVPFEELRYWLRGIPAEAAPNHGATDITLDAAGRLQTFRQGNWLVAYLDYAVVAQPGVNPPDSGALELPRQLSITAVPGSMEIYARNGEYLGDQLSVKVILKRWWDVEFDR